MTDCILALVIRHEQGMSLTILPPVTCLILLHFSTLSHERHDFREGGITEH